MLSDVFIRRRMSTVKTGLARENLEEEKRKVCHPGAMTSHAVEYIFVYLPFL